ncbi:MAG: integrase [Armatimonadetes bacterium]|nr:integrase [Armatimonadota bacterium]
MASKDLATALIGERHGGSLQPHFLNLAEHLVDQGYAVLSVRNYLQAASHLGQWMNDRDIPLTGLTDETLGRFARHRCRCSGARGAGRRPSPMYVRRIRSLVECLRSLGIARPGPVMGPPTHPVLVSFRDWMLRHRGLSAWTIKGHEFRMSKLLPALGDDPSVYDATGVRQALLAHVQGLSRAYAKSHVSVLRTFLRYLAVEGRCRPGLEEAVPTIPSWRLSSLPRYLDPPDVERVIESCDLSRACGLRDRAVLLLLARLGLRAGDIITMTLEDVDWQAGTLRVRGKGRKEVCLPLPQDAGDAILEYLSRARPVTKLPQVFLCSHAPIRAFPASSTVSDIVRLALERAGIANPPSKGAHLLRHSAATAMLRRGASLDAIATVLRHQSTDTTAHYAKVDTKLLAGVTQPWPEVSNAER